MKAIVFDFDGVVLDTETADYQSWHSLYARHGAVLPLEDWMRLIGTDPATAGFDPGVRLAELTGIPETELRAERAPVYDALARGLEPMSGILDWIRDADRLGVQLAIASSSPLWWVDGHLGRVGLRSAFETLATAEDVERVKPDPALYQLALDRLGISAVDAFAIEDSLHGVAAARAAGLACVAVPGPMTETQDFDAASCRMSTLADRSLADMIEELARLHA